MVEVVLVVKMTSPVQSVLLPARREIFIISDNLNVTCCYHLELIALLFLVSPASSGALCNKAIKNLKIKKPYFLSVHPLKFLHLLIILWRNITNFPHSSSVKFHINLWKAKSNGTFARCEFWSIGGWLRTGHRSPFTLLIFLFDLSVLDTAWGAKVLVQI